MILKALKKRLKSDKADSEMVSLVLLLPLVLGILFTMIDTSIYFSNRAAVATVARDGARTVAIMGGNGTATTQTPIEHKYGLSKAEACAGLSTHEVVKKAFSNPTTIECNVMRGLAENSALVNVEITRVICSPNTSSYIGQRTSCAIEWNYGSIPGSALTLIKGSKDSGEVDVDKHGFAGEQKTIGTSESEVALPGSGILVPRH